MKPFDQTSCELGEGPLWHPGRQSLIWFDINGCKMFEKGQAGRQEWAFERHVTAAGWVDDTTLVVAEEQALLRFDLSTGVSEMHCPIEADNPVTRSNDGRADPWGGFWIGTMGKNMEAQAGAIYRYYRGELRTLYPNWTIPNATCFSPDRRFAYFTDTPVGIIWRVALDSKDGWPKGTPEAFITFPANNYRPDGAIIDAEGHMWCAHFGHSKITRHTPDGREVETIPVPATQVTCPAFGGPNLDQLFVTTASKTLNAPLGLAGQTFVSQKSVKGQSEQRVLL